MLCDTCKKRDAVVFLTQVHNGKLRKVNYCDPCAIDNGVREPIGFSLADLLSGIHSPKDIETNALLPKVCLPVTTEALFVSAQVNHKLIEHFNAHPMELKDLDRRLFEELVAELWDGFGYEVELTQQTRDGGKDIIAVRKAYVHERYLIECKRPDAGNIVGIRPVRELYGVKVSERATKGILATTALFSRDAQLFFEENKWELEGRDYLGLLEWIKLYLTNTNGT